MLVLPLELAYLITTEKECLFPQKAFTADDLKSPSKAPRMLHVRTDLIETNLKLGYTFHKEKAIFKGFYFSTGIGLAFYNPMAQRNDIWFSLRPLGREGQLIDPSKSQYPAYTPVIPFKLGRKFGFSSRLQMSIDVSFRKCFTDYLDDVYTHYYSRSEIREKSGAVAAHFAYPAFNKTRIDRTGNARGNSGSFDNYILVGVKLFYPLKPIDRLGKKHTVCNFQNGWINSFGEKPNFKGQGRLRNKLFRQ